MSCQLYILRYRGEPLPHLQVWDRCAEAEGGCQLVQALLHSRAQGGDTHRLQHTAQHSLNGSLQYRLCLHGSMKFSTSSTQTSCAVTLSPYITTGDNFCSQRLAWLPTCMLLRSGSSALAAPCLPFTN